MLPLKERLNVGRCGIVDVVLLERKNLAVAREAVDDADLLSVQAHRKRVEFLRDQTSSRGSCVLSSSPSAA